MDELTAELYRSLAAYDGRTTAELNTIRAALADRDGYLHSLITLSDSPQIPIADGATWLLLDTVKHGRADGASLSPADMVLLLDKLSGLPTWGAKLHICQSMRHLPIEATHLPLLVDFLNPLLVEKKPFLRAWSLDALVHLASLDKSLQGKADSALAAAMQDPAESVRARARNLV